MDENLEESEEEDKIIQSELKKMKIESGESSENASEIED